MTTHTTTIGPDGNPEPNPRRHLYRVLRHRDRLVLDTSDGQVVVTLRLRRGGWRLDVEMPPAVLAHHEREDRTP